MDWRKICCFNAKSFTKAETSVSASFGNKFSPFCDVREEHKPLEQLQITGKETTFSVLLYARRTLEVRLTLIN